MTVAIHNNIIIIVVAVTGVKDINMSIKVLCKYVHCNRTTYLVNEKFSRIKQLQNPKTLYKHLISMSDGINSNVLETSIQFSSWMCILIRVFIQLSQKFNQVSEKRGWAWAWATTISKMNKSLDGFDSISFDFQSATATLEIPYTNIYVCVYISTEFHQSK